MNLDTARLAEIFARQPEKRFCTTCLASELGPSLSDVRSALVTLSAEVILDRDAGQCVRCRSWSVVYGLGAADAEIRSPEDRLAEFLRDKAGTRFCNACLCRELRLPPHVVRKAADRLRMAGTAALQGGRCAICERLRLVLGRAMGDERNTSRSGIA